MKISKFLFLALLILGLVFIVFEGSIYFGTHGADPKHSNMYR